MGQSPNEHYTVAHNPGALCVLKWKESHNIIGETKKGIEQ